MLCDHNAGQGHLRSPGKKVKHKNRDLELRYMFLDQTFAKNAKNDPKPLFKASKSVKKNRKITVKSRIEAKSACFLHVLCHISAIFEDIDLKLYTRISRITNTRAEQQTYRRNKEIDTTSIQWTSARRQKQNQRHAIWRSHARTPSWPGLNSLILASPHLATVQGCGSAQNHWIKVR